MKYFSLKANNQALFNLVILFVFILLSNVSVFAQSSTKNVVDVNSLEINANKKTENASIGSSSNNMNFVLWFMGSKQDPNSTISTEGTNTKKQIITSGVAPNRLLIKSFLKKAVNLDSMIA
jgi:hypothetical protein